MIEIILILLGVCFGIVLLIPLALLIRARLNAPEVKGKKGENAVAKALGKTVVDKQYLINDLLFEVAGRSCQIDHVFICKNGVWVIETKNYAGQIYGNESEREWTQVVGSAVNTFLNPVKQNLTHICRLKEYLNTNSYFFNLVVFTARADLANVSADGVLYLSDLSSIKTRDTGITLTNEQMKDYFTRLTELKNTSAITKAEHLDNIRKMQKNVMRGICPRCGARLILRTGQNTEFYGCSAYPDCTFTAKKN